YVFTFGDSSGLLLAEEMKPAPSKGIRRDMVVSRRGTGGRRSRRGRRHRPRAEEAMLGLVRLRARIQGRDSAGWGSGASREISTLEAYSNCVEGVEPSATPETGPFPAPQREA